MQYDKRKILDTYTLKRLDQDRFFVLMSDDYHNLHIQDADSSPSLQYLEQTAHIALNQIPDVPAIPGIWVFEEDEFDKKVRTMIDMLPVEEAIQRRATQVSFIVKKFPKDLADAILHIENMTRNLQENSLSLSESQAELMKGYFSSDSEIHQQIRALIKKHTFSSIRPAENIQAKPEDVSPAKNAQQASVRVGTAQNEKKPKVLKTKKPVDKQQQKLEKQKRYYEIIEKELPAAETNLEQIRLYEELLPLVNFQKDNGPFQPGGFKRKIYEEKARIYGKLHLLYNLEYMFQKADEAKDKREQFLKARDLAINHSKDTSAHADFPYMKKDTYYR